MTLDDLRAFSVVAAEGSFSRAARKLQKTQPAISQAVQRLEREAGERLIDRSSRDGALTDAGELMLDYAGRLLRLTEEARRAVSDLRDVRSGRVLIGSNEGAVHAVLPLIERFHRTHPGVLVDVRRVPARQIAHEVLLRGVDFGVLTFKPPERDLSSVVLGSDELVLLVPPSHPLAGGGPISMEVMGQQVVIAHNDPSPSRDEVLRLYEERRLTLNIRLSLPSLDAIKRAVEAGLGVALLPRRCAHDEIARGQLAAVRVPELSSRRELHLVFRREGKKTHAANAFLTQLTTNN
jgi:DNA-binding transcriptional LysR family regulator